MAYVPFATEFSALYSLTSPSGAVAVLNDPTNPYYAGMVKEITGLDSAEVRESASDLVEADGGEHGRFYYGRRPVTITVSVVSHPDMLTRAQRIDRLHRAAQGLRGDCTLYWAPTYSPSTGMYLPVRLQQPIRDTGGWAKEVQLALVSHSAVILGYALNDSGSFTLNSGGAGGVATVENQGSYDAYPLIEMTGASTNPSVWDSSGRRVYTGPSGYTLTLAAGETVQIDTLKHSAVFTAGARAGQSANRYIDFGLTTAWPFLNPAGNTTFSGSGTGTFRIKWRSAWH